MAPWSLPSSKPSSQTEWSQDQEEPVDVWPSDTSSTEAGSTQRIDFKHDQVPAITTPGMNSELQKTPGELELLKAKTKNARRFYEADKELSAQDRRTMLKAFQYQMFSQYTGVAAGVFIGILGPRYMFNSIFKRPLKSSHSTVACLASIFACSSTAQTLSTKRNLNSFEGNQRYIDIWNIMKWHSPMIGYLYYKETVSRPKSAFPDPATLDWTQYPPFPSVLTWYERYIMDVKGTESESQELSSIQEYKSLGPSKVQSGLQSSTPQITSSDQDRPTPTISAWERVRTKHENPYSSSIYGEERNITNGSTSQSSLHVNHSQPPSDLETFEDPFEEDSK